MLWWPGTVTEWLRLGGATGEQARRAVVQKKLQQDTWAQLAPQTPPPGNMELPPQMSSVLTPPRFRAKSTFIQFWGEKRSSSWKPREIHHIHITKCYAQAILSIPAFSPKQGLVLGNRCAYSYMLIIQKLLITYHTDYKDRSFKFLLWWHGNRKA